MIQLSLVAFFFLFLFQQTGNSRFVPRSVINTTAILSLDEDIKLNSDEVNIMKGVQCCNRLLLFNFHKLYEFRFSDWLICTT